MGHTSVDTEVCENSGLPGATKVYENNGLLKQSGTFMRPGHRQGRAVDDPIVAIRCEGFQCLLASKFPFRGQNWSPYPENSDKLKSKYTSVARYVSWDVMQRTAHEPCRC